MNNSIMRCGTVGQWVALCMSFLCLCRFPPGSPTFQKHAGRWTSYTKISPRCELVCECVYMVPFNGLVSCPGSIPFSCPVGKCPDSLPPT